MIEASLQLFEENRQRNGGSADRALAETIQYIALLGLSRTDFSDHAAFYGGTALRLLYGLDRFSEDLDFSLLHGEDDFRIADYLKGVREELEAYGFTAEVKERIKRIDTPIESAFIKANTKIHIVETKVPESVAGRIPGNAVCKVKLEVDTDPPPGARFEVRYIDEPVPFSIRAYEPSSLFAGKMAAVLARGWKSRVKGRDWYDFAFFVKKKIPLFLKHLEARLRQIGFFENDRPLEAANLDEMIRKRIREVNLESARADVVRFIRNPADLDVWSEDYFMYVADNIVYTSE